MTTVALSDCQLVLLAALIVDELEARRTVPTRSDASGIRPALVDAAEVARRLGVGRSTVYAHSRELGAVEVGTGRRPRLRFDLEKALETWTHRHAGPTRASEPSVAAERRRRRGPSNLGGATRLLPVVDRLDPARRRAIGRGDERREAV
jgi:excisionase family DNA binding protein